MRQSGDMVRAVCQPKHKVTDGKLSMKSNKPSNLIIFFSVFLEVVLGAREGIFPDEKNFKVIY